MFQEVTYYLIFGIPFIVYIGIVAIVLFAITGLIAVLKRKQKIRYSVQWHYKLAYVSIGLGLIHAILGLLAYI